jgi:hypothetical protein
MVRLVAQPHARSAHSGIARPVSDQRAFDAQGQPPFTRPRQRLAHEGRVLARGAFGRWERSRRGRRRIHVSGRRRRRRYPMRSTNWPGRKGAVGRRRRLLVRIGQWLEALDRLSCRCGLLIRRFGAKPAPRCAGARAIRCRLRGRCRGKGKRQSDGADRREEGIRHDALLPFWGRPDGTVLGGSRDSHDENRSAIEVPPSLSLGGAKINVRSGVASASCSRSFTAGP